MGEMTRFTFADWLDEELQDAEFRAEYERLEPGFEVARLRTLRGLTQDELARRVGTHQSSISRLETGESEPSVSFLRRVVEAMDGRLEIQAVPREHSVMVETEETNAQSGAADVYWGSFTQDLTMVNWSDQNEVTTSPEPLKESGLA